MGEIMVSVELINFDLAAIDLLLMSWTGFEHRYSLALADYGDVVADLAQRTRSILVERSLDPKWCEYLAVDTSARVAVGSCGYTGPPSADGVVEIACRTFPSFEGQGYATSMAECLMDFAVRSGAKRVIAHTKAKASSSTRILAKLGFVLRKEVNGGEERKQWQWEREEGRST